MNITQRKPVTVGEIITEEFLIPLNITQGELADAMGVSRKTINEICNNRRSLTADTALMLSRVFDSTPQFWLNTQQRNDIWLALNSPKRRAKIEHAIFYKKIKHKKEKKRA